MLAIFMLSVDFNTVSWKGVKFRGRPCQRRDMNIQIRVRCAVKDRNGLPETKFG
jgi:hypothetical protein